MSTPRDDILGGIRRALRRGAVSPDAGAEIHERVAAHRRNLVPARAAALGRKGRIELFVAMAEAVQTTVARVASQTDIPAEVARYLAAENLPAELVVAPDASLDGIPWDQRPLLQIRRGRAEAYDAVSLTPSLAGIAETGTLMLASGPDLRIRTGVPSAGHGAEERPGLPGPPASVMSRDPRGADGPAARDRLTGRPPRTRCRASR